MRKWLTAHGISTYNRRSIGTEVTDGLKPAIGRYVKVDLDQRNIQFLLGNLAGDYPEAFIAIAGVLTKHGHTQTLPRSKNYGSTHRLDSELREAITQALAASKERYGKQVAS